MKRIASALISAAALLSVFGCARDERPPMSSETELRENNASYEFIDDAGRAVSVKSTERVAALLGSYADIWYLAGGTICASADDAWEDFDLPIPDDAVNLGGTKNLSLEALLSANPDFVIASTNTPQHLEWQSALESSGIAVAYFDVTNFDDYLRMLKICSDITGRPEVYEQYGTELQRRIDEIVERERGREPQTALVMRASAASIRAKNSSSTVLGEILNGFGCVNIADGDDTLLENLNIESIVIANPDKIFFIESGDDLDGIRKNVEKMFDENPLWKELDAVKNGEVYYMDKRLYNLKPNARWAEAYETVENILYGEK